METRQITPACLIAACSLILLLETGLWIALNTWPGSKWPLLATTRVLETAACWAAAARFGCLPVLGLWPSRFGPALVMGAIWSAVFAATGLAVYTGTLLLTGINLLPVIRAQLPSKFPDVAWLLVVGGIVGPVAEEFFFRGIVYGYLRRWGAALAVCGSTALFISLHSVGGFPFNQLVGGVIFALAYEKSRSLAAPVVIHVTGNLAIFSISLLAA